ncbi:putative UvrD superfamily I DNA helicase [Pseudomonas phage JG054]|uniref:DNA 3'-5' helicase n=1 Tax=Pseudomonas phage JG054 TaxID=1970800 RepID=A0A2H4GYC0_9CAUD|nr:putative UvrD superfamily I DNA helicase [Pseudomonas phage JG054]ARB11211.1 putative UvrD superfamily I DNA helicase [Pseudomonas phage JG054]
MAQLNFDASTVKPFNPPTDIEDQPRDTSRKWSPLQHDIFNFVEHGQGNAIVEAVAGSGKSTTIVEALKRVTGSSIFLAFNKSIAEELKARGVNARTFHSLTYGPVTQARGVRTVDTDKLRRLCDAKLKGEDAAIYGSFISKLVGLGRQVGIGCLVPDLPQTWMDICIHHDLEPDHDLADLGRAIELASELLQHSNESSMVDFDDLLYLAVKDGISLPKFDFIFVDEAQDTNAIQRALLRKIMRKGARIVAVGDPAQAIYGFRGADSESLNLIAQEFDAVRLPLSITYRCPTSVVKYAQQWVSHIQAAPGAREGEVLELGRDWNMTTFKANDLVVCRKTAPLMTLAFKFLRARVPVMVMGREIGAGLKSLINKMNARSLEHLEQKLEAYRDREVEKALAKKDDAKVEAIEDRISCITCLIDSMPEDQRTIPALLNTLDTLFADKRNAVVLATIHKAKGLEAKRVFWLDRSQCPAKWARQDWQRQQEVNLCYVAATRAMESLITIELGS